MVVAIPLASCDSKTPVEPPPTTKPPAQAQTTTLETPDPRLDDALRGVMRGDFDGARRLATLAAEQQPGSARAAFVVALTYHKQKNYGAAEPHFARALELGPTFEPFAPVHYFHAWCLYYLGRLPEAREAFETHLSLVPDEADSFFGLGVIALDEGQLPEAERQLEEARKRNAAAAATDPQAE